MPPKIEEGGELVVTGHDKISIPLADFPRRINVVFKHKHEPPPCDPHHHHHVDELEWEIHKHHGGHGHSHLHTLVIRWKVRDIREIVWTAQF